MRERVFKWLAGKVISKPKKLLIFTAIITIIMLLFAANLNLELSWVGMAPKGDPSATEYEKILDKFPSVSKIDILVEDKGDNPEQAAQIAAEKLVDLSYVKNVNYKIDTDFLLDHALLLARKDDVKNITPFLEDPNLTGFITNMNDLYEKEYRGNSGNIQDDEKELARTLRGLQYFLQAADGSLAGDLSGQEFDEGVTRLLTGDPYLRSIRGNSILMTVQPTFSMMNYQKLKPGVDAIEGVLNTIEKDHPGFRYGLTGMHVVGRDEMVSTEKDSTLAMILGLALVLIILISAFRMWTAPLLAAIPLIVGIIWDMGLAWLTIGRLNLLTIFTAAILIGLGIDFSVHILSGYTEARSDDCSAEEAVHYTLEKVGPGILTGALTTAAAFFTLAISSLGFLVELGVIMGMGILTTTLAVFLILPTLLYLKTEKWGDKKVEKGRYPAIGAVAAWTGKRRFIVLAVVLLLVMFAGWRGTKTEFYLNIEKIEPKGLESIQVMDEISEKFGMSNDALMYTTEDLDETYQLAKELKDKPRVDSVDTITDYLPPVSIQEERLNNLRQLNVLNAALPEYQVTDKEKLINELERLNDNIIEIGQLSFMSGIDGVVNVTDRITGTKENPGILPNLIAKIREENYQQGRLITLSQKFYQSLKEKSSRMKEVRKVTLSDVPESIRTQFVSDDGSLYLSSVHAAGNLWQRIKEPFGKEFIHMMRETVPEVTGTPVFMRVLYDQTSREVTRVIALISATIFILLLIHFKSLKEAFIAFIPLITALILTMGTVEITGINLDIFSVLAFPLIIGIGIDDGVHVIHRLNITGESLEDVFSSVGRAILLTSLTTMASFGSLMIAKYQGIFRLGSTLFIGVAFCFVMTVILIPVFLGSRKE